MSRFRSAWTLLLGVKIHIRSSGSTQQPCTNHYQTQTTIRNSNKVKKRKTKRNTATKALVVTSKKVEKIVPSQDLEMSQPERKLSDQISLEFNSTPNITPPGTPKLMKPPFHSSYLRKNYLHPYYRNQWIGMGLSTCSWHIRAVNATVCTHFATWIEGTPLCSTWFADQELFFYSCGNKGEDKGSRSGWQPGA